MCDSSMPLQLADKLAQQQIPGCRGLPMGRDSLATRYLLICSLGHRHRSFTNPTSDVSRCHSSSVQVLMLLPEFPKIYVFEDKILSRLGLWARIHGT